MYKRVLYFLVLTEALILLWFVILNKNRTLYDGIPALLYTTCETHHFRSLSTASEEDTIAALIVAEALYKEISAFFSFLPDTDSQNKYESWIFKDREQFRSRMNVQGWAEAFYRTPRCYLYIDRDEQNKYHWFLHETTHQLCKEYAKLRIPQWLNEGLACYFSASEYTRTGFELGQPDPYAYPIWHMHEKMLSGDCRNDKEKLNFLPLETIVSGVGGPDINRCFNLYYVHWWSLCHFLIKYENGKYLKGLHQVILEGGTPESFEKNIGKFDSMEIEWYGYFIKQTVLISALKKKDPLYMFKI